MKNHLDYSDIILQTIQDAIDGYVITQIKKNDHVVVFCSDSFSRLTGYSKNEIIGRNCRFLQGKETNPFHVKQMSDAIKSEIPYRGIILNYRKDGTPFWNLIQLKPIRDEHHNLQYYSGIQTEIKQMHSTVVQLQAELAHLARLQHIDESSASIFHELRQPLAVITTYTSGLIRKTDQNNSKGHQATLEQINAQAHRANNLITHLSSFSKKSQHEKITGCINQVIEEALLMLKSSLLKIDIELKLEKHKLKVWMDKVQLLQVFVNIIQNAIEAFNDSTHNPCIIIEAHHSEDTVYIDISNNGPALSEHILGQLFKPFFTTKKQGTGIGLALVDRIISLHKGKITVSNMQNGYTQFSIELPMGKR